MCWHGHRRVRAYGVHCCRCVSALVPVISAVAAKMHMSADEEASGVRERFSLVVRSQRTMHCLVAGRDSDAILINDDSFASTFHCIWPNALHDPICRVTTSDALSALGMPLPTDDVFRGPRSKASLLRRVCRWCDDLGLDPSRLMMVDS